MIRSPLALHLPDADHLTAAEIGAVVDLSPSALLAMCYAQWDNDKGAAFSITDLVMSLGHDRLYVRFHADPHPPGYAKKIGGPEAWGRLCAQRMTQYYGGLTEAGVQLHAILANETDADYEGGLSVAEASDFHRRSMAEYAAKRPQDILHVPAPTGAPSTHREHLEQYRHDGWVRPEYWIDGHGYNGDLENVVNVLHEVFPGHEYVITETNNLDDFAWPISLLDQGRARDIVYFILNWARGGEGRVQPPSADDAEKQMSLMRHPARYAQFKATATQPPVPEPTPEPEPPMPDFPLPSWTPAYQHIFEGAVDVADEYGLPRDLLLGLCYAESGDGLQSFDRWHRWSVEALNCIANHDRAGLGSILDRCAAVPTNDISFGPCHQTWRWSDEFNGDPYDLQAILEFRKKYIEDHGHALRVAAGRVAPFWGTYGPDKAETLCRYNKPDGTATASVRLRYQNMLTLAAQQLGVIDPQPEPAPTETIYESYPDPEPAGVIQVPPLGVIFHGSRSGKAGNPLDAEYRGTASYEVNNPFGLGWNATVGPGVVALHMDARRWGWNARAASSKYIGVEIAQPTVNDPLPASMATALADYIYDHVWPVWGELWHFPSHAEVEAWGETGHQDGKTDLYPTGDERMNGLRQQVYDRLNARKAAPQPQPPEPEPAPPDYATLTALAYYEDGVVVPALAAALANPDDVNLRIQVDSVLRWLRENSPKR